MKEVLKNNIEALLKDEWEVEHIWVKYAQGMLEQMENDGSGGDYDDCYQTTEKLHKDYNYRHSDEPLSLARVKNILNILQDLELISLAPGGTSEADGSSWPDEWVKNYQLNWQ